jgi:predicted RNase H-like nuclease (RuvC/YqgF family)
MWKQIFDYAKQIASQAARLQQVEEGVKDLRSEVTRLDREIVELNRKFDALLAVVRHLEILIDHDRQDAARQYENLVLRLENTLLRFERCLPPGGPPDDLISEPS